VHIKFWWEYLDEKTTRRPRRRWEGTIRTNLREIGWKVVDWMHMAQDRNQWRAVVNTVMNLWIP
jgi:hypothetical protein